MANQTSYGNVKHVVYISTDISDLCNHCNYNIGSDGYRGFQNSINHYINDHGYQLLHVGSETGTDSNGNPFNSTVAVVGK